MDPVLDSHGPWIFLVAIPVFVIFSFRAFFTFRRRRPPNSKAGSRPEPRARS